MEHSNSSRFSAGAPRDDERLSIVAVVAQLAASERVNASAALRWRVIDVIEAV